MHACERAYASGLATCNLDLLRAIWLNDHDLTMTETIFTIDPISLPGEARGGSIPTMVPVIVVEGAPDLGASRTLQETRVTFVAPGAVFEYSVYILLPDQFCLTYLRLHSFPRTFQSLPFRAIYLMRNCLSLHMSYFAPRRRLFLCTFVS